jgi:hypothetical protein
MILNNRYGVSIGLQGCHKFPMPTYLNNSIKVSKRKKLLAKIIVGIRHSNLSSLRDFCSSFSFEKEKNSKARRNMYFPSGRNMFGF